MNKKFFPGANSGEGFYSRFDGILPPAAEHHYTYILKGGPGVGKNTLMKKAAKQAANKGYSVEEFRCASDPKSLDAIRIPKIGVIILDGTSPHGIDPKLPGIDDEIIDLGHFKNCREFLTYREPVVHFFGDNKRHYGAAYAMLKAACILKKEMHEEVRSLLNTEKLHSFLSRLLASKKQGNARRLFARSATPDGVTDFSPSFLPDNTTVFSGVIGEVALDEAQKMLFGRQCEIFYDFINPNVPHSIVCGDTAICLGEKGDNLSSMCRAELPPYFVFYQDKIDSLVKRATAELSKALAVHDQIEAIYRDYVDYDFVNEQSEKLLKRIGL